MAAHDHMTHDSSDGTDWSTRLKKYYNYNTWTGENVAYGYLANETGAQVFTSWKNSPDHNANMLGTNYTVIGISRVYSATQRCYWTTDFGGYKDALLSAGWGTIAANGSFESDAFTTGVGYSAVRTLNRWHTNATRGGTVARETERATAGTYGLRATDTDAVVVSGVTYHGNTAVTQVVKAASGVNYGVSAKTWHRSGGTQTVYLDFLDANYQRISVVTVPTGNTAAWTPVSTSATSPANTRFVRIILWGSPSAGQASSIDYDDVRVTAL
jgi:hypothetical protein